MREAAIPNTNFEDKNFQAQNGETQLLILCLFYAVVQGTSALPQFGSGNCIHLFHIGILCVRTLGCVSLLGVRT